MIVVPHCGCPSGSAPRLLSVKLLALSLCSRFMSAWQCPSTRVANEVDSGVDSGVSSVVDSRVDSGVDSGVDSRVDSRVDSGVSSRVDSGVGSDVQAPLSTAVCILVYV